VPEQLQLTKGEKAMTRNTNVKMLFELRSLSAATTRLALLDYFFGQTEKAATIRQRGFTTGNLGDYLNEARHEIGLPALSGAGAEQAYLRSHVVDEDASDGAQRIFLADAQRVERGSRYFKPTVKSWGEAWRFLFAPSHREVRDNAKRGELAPHPLASAAEGVATYRFMPVSNALPTLDLHHVRDVRALKAHLAAYHQYRFPRRPGDARDVTDEYFDHVALPQIYVLLFTPGDEEPADDLVQTYVGQTTEPEIRFPQHQAGYGKSRKRRIRDAFIAVPAPHEGALTSEEQDIAESMCINFFKEIANNDNHAEGGDTLPPDMAPVRRAAAFATAFCAGVLRLVRDQGIGFSFHEEVAGVLRRKDGPQTVIERYLNNGEQTPA
jgi:hypothetical protein